jgi:transcriptional regulator with XRE-family HTH domain
MFIQNQAKLDNYLKWMNDNALKLPEDPTFRGKVFFAQVAVEAGLGPNALAARNTARKSASNDRLRQSVENAVSKLGLEVRVLPQSPVQKQTPLTYEQLLKWGTEERKKELKESRSAAAQLYNTRHALNLFLQTLKMEATAPVGPEFVSRFKFSVKKVLDEISNTHSRKKFNTEINRWQDIYQRLLKGPSIPDDFHQATRYLVDRSGLSLSVLAKLIGVSLCTLSEWYHGRTTPNSFSVQALERMESLFMIPAGTLVNKIPSLHTRRQFRRSDLPLSLQQNRGLFHRLRPHLPDNFCTLMPEVQEEIIESIRTEILRGGDDEYEQRLVTLQGLPYRLKQWPQQIRAEFDTYADFKMAEIPPPRMKKQGKWKLATKRMQELDFACLFGAIRLPPNADDVRVRGLGFPESQMTLALIVCPEIIDWYIKFRFEVRSQYTELPISLLNHYMSMLRRDTGWLRQTPSLASRLHPFACGDTQYITNDLVSHAQVDWDGVCDDAIIELKKMVEKIKPLITVLRDPFHRIEGLLALDNPMKPLGELIKKMRHALPSHHTAPSQYHTGIRDLVITAMIVITGFRRSMFPKLDYTGDKKGHLYYKEGQYVLSVPRTFFKNPDSSYFLSNRVKEDYLSKLPDKHGLYKLLKEYLETSRPFLMKTYHSRSIERPLFPKTKAFGGSPRLSDLAISHIYAKNVEKYLVENKHRGTGLHKVKRSGPHSVRHVRGTTIYRKTGSFKLAGDANQHSEQTARRHYSRTTTAERNQKVSKILFDDE